MYLEAESNKVHVEAPRALSFGDTSIIFFYIRLKELTSLFLAI
jgi:hypothetical protein